MAHDVGETSSTMHDGLTHPSDSRSLPLFLPLSLSLAPSISLSLFLSVSLSLSDCRGGTGPRGFSRSLSALYPPPLSPPLSLPLSLARTLSFSTEVELGLAAPGVRGRLEVLHRPLSWIISGQ